VVIYIYERRNDKKTEKENIFYQIERKPKVGIEDKKNYSGDKLYQRIPKRNRRAALAAFSS
jgi:hypothetical protein